MRRWILMAAVAGGAAGIGAILGVAAAPRLDAAKARAELDVSFGPVVVESRAGARAYLSVRNFGTAAATLSPGDLIDVTYGQGTEGTALAFTGSPLVASDLPNGVSQQPLAGTDSTPLGVRIAFSGFTLGAGTTLLVPFDFVAGEPGLAPVAVDLRLGKAAGRFPKRIESRVVKSPPRAVSFYGDGSDGAVTLGTSFPAESPWKPLANYTDVTISDGVTVTVLSGTTIRCTGNFENRGTIVVLPGAPGGGLSVDNVEGPVDLTRERIPSVVAVGAGDASAAPTLPSIMRNQASGGARGGVGLGGRADVLPLSHYRHGGGGGSGALGAIGGAGGGLLRVLARGEVRNPGTIRAPGQVSTSNRTTLTAAAGAGGGGGGIVILAAGARADTTGTIDVRGGNGGGPDVFGASGGGGGGGLVVLAAPQVGSFGATQLDGGTAPLPTGPVPGAGGVWCGGGGGGACAGDGGDGYPVAADGTLNGVAGVVTRPASIGILITRTADPRTLW